MSATSDIPSPTPAVGWLAAQALARDGYILGALEALRDGLGDVFALPLPGFNSVVLSGPEANRFLLTEASDDVRWRSEGDPVTHLLRRGLLVVDGEEHDGLRRLMTPALHRSLFGGYVEAMWKNTDRVTGEWREGTRIDLFDEMRRIALLILTETLFSDDFEPQMRALWRDIERTLAYISPGAWLIWPGIPRPGYAGALRRLVSYFDRLIALHRVRPVAHGKGDLIDALLASGLRDDHIRDQILTMFIAGHDTSTSLLAWTLYLLAIHPESLAQVVAEVDRVVGDEPPTLEHVRTLPYLDCVIKEALRLYPPIHLGARVAAQDLAFQGYRIPAGARVLYSIYLTHHDRRYWPEPHLFDPSRFAAERGASRPAYTYLPFGGGPRNCIGAAFAQVEAKIVLARLLQRYEFRFVGGKVRPRMQATLVPHPGVLVEAWRRSKS